MLHFERAFRTSSRKINLSEISLDTTFINFLDTNNETFLNSWSRCYNFEVLFQKKDHNSLLKVLSECDKQKGKKNTFQSMAQNSRFPELFIPKYVFVSLTPSQRQGNRWITYLHIFYCSYLFIHLKLHFNCMNF